MWPSGCQASAHTFESCACSIVAEGVVIGVTEEYEVSGVEEFLDELGLEKFADLGMTDEEEAADEAFPSPRIQ